MDPIYPLIDHHGKIPALAETARVQREFDDGLRVIWDVQREKFVVLDTKAPGGPDAAYVMVVQNPDGSFRPFDQRTIDTLRYLYDGHDRVKIAVANMEAERERAVKKRRENTGDEIEDTLKYLGQVITPSVVSRDRSIAREQIRDARGD